MVPVLGDSGLLDALVGEQGVVGKVVEPILGGEESLLPGVIGDENPVVEVVLSDGGLLSGLLGSDGLLGNTLGSLLDGGSESEEQVAEVTMLTELVKADSASVGISAVVSGDNSVLQLLVANTPIQDPLPVV